LKGRRAEDGNGLESSEILLAVVLRSIVTDISKVFSQKFQKYFQKYCLRLS